MAGLLLLFSAVLSPQQVLRTLISKDFCIRSRSQVFYNFKKCSRISGTQANELSEKQGEELQFVVFADFYRANTSAIANFKLLVNF